MGAAFPFTRKMFPIGLVNWTETMKMLKYYGNRKDILPHWPLCTYLLHGLQAVIQRWILVALWTKIHVSVFLHHFQMTVPWGCWCMLPEGIDGGRPSSIPDKREPAGKGMLVAFIPCLLTAGGILEYENTWSYCFFFGTNSSNVAKYIAHSSAKCLLLWNKSKLHWTSTARRLFFFLNRWSAA
jgi:hypothetical protein